MARPGRAGALKANRAFTHLAEVVSTGRKSFGYVAPGVPAKPRSCELARAGKRSCALQRWLQGGRRLRLRAEGLGNL